MSALLDRVMQDEPGLVERLERERSRMTHEVFLLAESGAMPDEGERRSRARAATARAWMTHIAASLEPVWAPAPPGLGDSVDRWFSENGERLEVIELDLARRIADGPIDDLETRRRRLDLGAASRWLAEALGDLCEPGGDGGPAFARRVGSWLDGHGADVGEIAAAGREADPDDVMTAERAELMAHVTITVAALEASLPGLSGDPGPSA